MENQNKSTWIRLRRQIGVQSTKQYLESSILWKWNLMIIVSSAD